MEEQRALSCSVPELKIVFFVLVQCLTAVLISLILCKNNIVFAKDTRELFSQLFKYCKYSFSKLNVFVVFF